VRDATVLSALFADEFPTHDGHIIVMVPGVEDVREEEYPDYPKYPLYPVVFYEHSLGASTEWKYPFDSIARCKAQQLWRSQNDGRTDCEPHLLFPDDTPFWGGVKRQSIVVACSGYKPYLDKMISGMIADMIIALSYHAWMTSADHKDDELCFLT
jgi:hypothetical protein